MDSNCNLPLAFASSPSGCAMRCIADGATPKGIEIFSPKIVVLKSLFETSLKNLGRILYLKITCSTYFF